MINSYEARHFRRQTSHIPGERAEGPSRFNAAGDAEAMVAARVAHADTYDCATDQIYVWELSAGAEDRLVGLIKGPLA